MREDIIGKWSEEKLQLLEKYIQAYTRIMNSQKKTGKKWLKALTEVEEVFANRPLYKLHERGKVSGEDLYAAYGQTDVGRYLTVFFIYKPNREALIVTARNMDRKERRRYAKK